MPKPHCSEPRPGNYKNSRNPPYTIPAHLLFLNHLARLSLFSFKFQDRSFFSFLVFFSFFWIKHSENQYESRRESHTFLDTGENCWEQEFASTSAGTPAPYTGSTHLKGISLVIERSGGALVQWRAWDSWGQDEIQSCSDSFLFQS